MIFLLTNKSFGKRLLFTDEKKNNTKLLYINGLRNIKLIKILISIEGKLIRATVDS